MQAVRETVEAWENIRSALCSFVGTDRFNRWLANIVLISLNQDLLKIGTSNRFILEWIESRYLPEIRKAAELVLGKTVKIELAISGKLFKRRSLDSPCPRNCDQDIIKPYRKLDLKSFVSGKLNKTAYRAVLHVLREKNIAFNPLLVLGGISVGKTHLLQGLEQEYKKAYPRLKIRYISSDEFCNSFRVSLKQKKIKKFRAYYRSLDLLIIDDFQLLTRKKKTQIEFLHTFDSLLNQQKKIVISSSMHPGDIADLSAPLKQRLIRGLVVRLRTPCLHARKIIIQNECRQIKRKINNDIVMFLATRFDRNIRELLGAVTRLLAYSSLEGGDLCLKEVKRLLADSLMGKRTEELKERIINIVCEQFGVQSGDIFSSSRKRRVVSARKIAIYLFRTYIDLSLREIGEIMGGRKAPTVRSAVKDIENKLKTDQDMSNILKGLTRSLDLGA